MTIVKAEELRATDTVRLERGGIRVEGVISHFENGNLIHLVGDDRPYSIHHGSKGWTFELIGRVHPPAFSVIRYPEVYDRPAFVRREDGYWARIPSSLDPTSVDLLADRKLGLEAITARYGWNFLGATS